MSDCELFAELSPPYRTIVVDPPWSYRTQAGITTRTRTRKVTANQHYSTMSNTEIAALPVRDLAANNAHLYLWATNPKLAPDRSGVGPWQIIERWGFRYITLLTWIKTGALGMGFYFRGETEHVLFGVRGVAPIGVEHREKNVITAAKTGHSRKPQSFLDLVERVSPGPYLELFAREPRLGWDSWGKGYEQAATA